MALIIQRLWSKLGIKLWTWLAWLIAFNFVNITWVFFRAKEWDDAVKVLGSMFSLDDVVLPNILESRLPFLSDLGVKFGGFAANIVANIEGDYLTPLWIFSGFVLVLMFKNSIQIIKGFKTSYKNLLIFIVTLFILATHLIYRLGESSEFLYFNF